MSSFRRSPSLESVSSVRSLESMQSIDSVKSFGSAHSPGGVSVKSSDYGVLNDMDMGRTITSAPVVPAVVNGDVEKPSPTDDGPPKTCDDEREPAPKSTVEPTPVDYRKHDRFYMDPRTIKLVLDDGTLYRVFRQSFAAHSTLFTKEYLAGRGDDEVIKLPGVSSVDLDRFLSLIYPSELATCELSSAQDWISVLRLAHRWSFPTLRARALREIEFVGNAVDKIAAAREFGVMETSKQWLMPAFVEACTTRSWLGSISVQNAERLGAGTILAIARIREEARDAEAGTYNVEQAIVVAGLAPGPSAKRSCTSQADLLRSMFSGRPAGLAGATIDESSSSATTKEPPTLVSTAPANSPRMPHHEDVSWPLPKAPWSAQSTHRGAPGLVAESVSSTSATVSHMNMVKEPVDETPPAEAPPVSMPDAAPLPTGSEAQPYPTPGAGSPPTPALASSPVPCSATARSTDRVAPPPIVDDQVPCATSLPNPAPSSTAPPSEATAYDALSRNALLALGTAAPSVPIDVQPAGPMSLNGASSSTDGSASRPTTPTISRTKLGKNAKKKLMRREQEMRKQEEERRAEAARTNSATLVPESADGARKEEQAGYPALACNTAGAKGQVEEPHAAVAVP